MRLVVAEDSVLLREGLIRLFTELGHEVVSAVGSAPELIDAIDLPNIDVVVTDVRMPPTHSDDGLRAAITIRETHPQVGVLVLSQWVHGDAARDLLRSGTGGVGYLLKDRVQDLTTIASALDVIHRGGMVIDPEVIAQVAVNQETPHQGIDRLTARELEVMSLMAQGRSNSAIAEGLVITLGAVEKHIASIFTKLDLMNSPDDHRRVLAVLRYLGD
ncbi:MAG: response regulator transcription factor [Propionibacteriaceae bacterium]|jgi:DNA-binding NarL/FixJ family response regulator|nr:response regulator transcription factor [Propionibacteriaceae bacterium]